MKKKMASTCPAWTEACCGNSGKVWHRQVRSSGPCHPGPAVAPEADRQKREEGQHRQDSSQADQAEHGSAVLAPRCRVVVVTEQQEVVDRRADALVGGFDQAQQGPARRTRFRRNSWRCVPFGVSTSMAAPWANCLIASSYSGTRVRR